MRTPSQQVSRITMWKIVVVGVCLCVFVFGLQAKLAQYQAPSPTVKAVSSAKLWDGDHRMEVQTLPDIAVLLAVAILLQFPFLLLEPSAPLPLLCTPAPVQLSRMLQLRRFFRPPPFHQ